MPCSRMGGGTPGHRHDAGSLLVPVCKRRQAFGGELVTRDSHLTDGPLDVRALAFDLDKVVHALVMLHAHHGAIEAVLADVALDGSNLSQPEPLEDGDERC